MKLTEIELRSKASAICREYRRKNNYSQKEMAKRSGVSGGSIVSIEARKLVMFCTIEKVMTRCGAALTCLLNLEENTAATARRSKLGEVLHVDKYRIGDIFSKTGSMTPADICLIVGRDVDYKGTWNTLDLKHSHGMGETSRTDGRLDKFRKLSMVELWPILRELTKEEPKEMPTHITTDETYHRIAELEQDKRNQQLLIDRLIGDQACKSPVISQG